MRTLVEQTRDEVKKWLDALANSAFANDDLRWLAINSPIVLIGGEESDTKQAQWDVTRSDPPSASARKTCF